MERAIIEVSGRSLGFDIAPYHPDSAALSP